LGFAQDIGEMYPGINGVAAPIFGPAEKLIGCIFIIGTFLEHLVEEYGLKVAMYAKQISSGFGNDIDKIYQNLANEKL
jgi:DNA-binding IclR family transcriptional regulator